ncbi:MAG: glutathione peroxidase, partial [Acholeplasmataceae bacterium]|nr:glutathione peroxidase [Acholeplasmataceae bacterium]
MNFYDFKYPLANKQNYDFEQLKDKVVLIVNTASNCGFAPQFEGLEELYQKYKDKGFVILGFPCDQFNHQEPNSAEQAQQICKLNYGVTFPIFDKIEVNGKNTTELYQHLKSQHRGLIKTIPWNFTKFLIG